MVYVHLAHVAVLEELHVVDLACVGGVQLQDQLLDLALGALHFAAGKTTDEFIVLDHALLRVVFLQQSLLQLTKVVRCNFLAKVLQGCILDLRLLDHLVDVREHLGRYPLLPDCALFKVLLRLVAGVLHNPRVGDGLGRCESAFVFSDQASFDQIFAFGRHVVKCIVVEVELSFDDVVNNFWLCPSWEGNFAREHDVKHDAHAPDVNFGVVVLQEHLGRHVVRRTA